MSCDLNRTMKLGTMHSHHLIYVSVHQVKRKWYDKLMKT